MSHEFMRKEYYDRERDRERDWDRNDYRRQTSRKRSRSRSRDIRDKRRSRSPRKVDKDILDENILSEISKLPEPSELWDSQTGAGGFQEAGRFPPPPPGPSFPPDAPPSSYGTNYQAAYGLYDDFPSVNALPPNTIPADVNTWNQMALPPPPTIPPATTNVEDQMKKEAAIESEMRHQKAALSKQREDYMKKASILKKELDTLKDQRNELRGDSKRSPSPDTKRFLKENTKLQLEIQNKLKTINNVVDMLNGIIGEEAQELPHDSDESERGSKRKSRSPTGKKFNYVYYDPEMHWCRVCNEFPSTAKDYLNHLHSPAHHKMAAAHMEAPWHSVSGVNEGFPNYPSAPTKRTPIRGLQFFVPSTAWYCKLCDQFIGDLHCASAHLKSLTHSKNYTNFVEQNPHWETDWMSDRQKAFEKSRSKLAKTEEKQPQYTAHTITFSKDGFHTKRKGSPPIIEDKKKKKDKKKKAKRKRSSSSSSSSNSSSSDASVKKKKIYKKEKKSEADDKTLTEWMSAIHTDRLTDSDRKLLDTLKNRIKSDVKRRSPDRVVIVPERKVRKSRSRSVTRRSPPRAPRRPREPRPPRAPSPPPPPDTKKPDVKKMPFIGKMPVYKNLTKITKPEEQKKDDQKKNEDEEAVKKRREEMDAEIKKKVAEFKEKIAKAQLEERQRSMPPPMLVLPTTLGASRALLPTPPPPALLPTQPPPAPVINQPPPPTQQQTNPQVPPNLSKDFQDALDIIFPSEVKKAEMAQQTNEMLAGFASSLGPAFGMPGVMPPFPPLMNPGLVNPQMMMGFDMNPQLFPRPQLYDTHVPIVPSKPRPNPKIQNIKRPNHKQNVVAKNQNQNQKPQNNSQVLKPVENSQKNSSVIKKKEELDDLAMLGIDASDVGAGI